MRLKILLLFGLRGTWSCKVGADSAPVPALFLAVESLGPYKLRASWRTIRFDPRLFAVRRIYLLPPPRITWHPPSYRLQQVLLLEAVFSKRAFHHLYVLVWWSRRYLLQTPRCSNRSGIAASVRIFFPGPTRAIIPPQLSPSIRLSSCNHERIHKKVDGGGS